MCLYSGRGGVDRERIAEGREGILLGDMTILLDELEKRRVKVLICGAVHKLPFSDPVDEGKV